MYINLILNSLYTQQNTIDKKISLQSHLFTDTNTPNTQCTSSIVSSIFFLCSLCLVYIPISFYVSVLCAQGFIPLSCCCCCCYFFVAHSRFFTFIHSFIPHSHSFLRLTFFLLVFILLCKFSSEAIWKQQCVDVFIRNILSACLINAKIAVEQINNILRQQHS